MPEWSKGADCKSAEETPTAVRICPYALPIKRIMNKTIYYVYKITNLVNQKIYIGVHKTNNINDGYMGSGKILKYAFDKYGINNFKKDILFICDSEQDMYDIEKRIVNDVFVKDKNTYNLKNGGSGGWDHINNYRTSDEYSAMAKMSRKVFSEKLKTDKGFKDNWIKNMSLRMRSDEVKSKISENVKKHIAQNGHAFEGKQHKESSKKIIGEKNSIKQQGVNNSQYGTMWIYSDTEKISKKIHCTEPIPSGWLKGRKFFKK